MIYNSEHFRLKAMTQKEQSQIQHDSLQEQAIAPERYLETVVGLYRESDGDYRGRRNEDQQLIAEYASEEADEYFDGALLGTLSLARIMNLSLIVPTVPEEDAQRQITLGDLADGESLHEMRSAWRQLWVGMNVITNRLKRDSEIFNAQGYPELFEMSEPNKKAFIDKLFGNFQELNALRFGAKGSGVRRTKLIPDIDGGGEPERVKFDPDVAKTLGGIANNAARRKYRVKHNANDEEAGPAIHAAGKLTPEEFIELRKEFPEEDMDRFAFDVAYSKDAALKYRGE
jgi:hypothetical protein